MEDPNTIEEDQEPMEVDEQPETEEGIRIGDIYISPPPLPACTFDATGPRLMISKIENINFKSYANKQVLGPFHKNFTSIVGPNGSGKSNVIDSMLFVFGYRAQKIRTKKISVLIHNSDSHKNIEKCTVSVFFQMIIDKDGDEYEVVPNSEFIISRTAFKDNTSWYAINKRKVQFKEVAKMLRSYGIDLDHNRFLILQGEVEQIAMMKPKAQGEHDTGMLEFLEDIIGCNRFKEPIALLASRAEDLNEQRIEKLNRVKAVEKDKDDIEAAKNEAVEYIKVENEIAMKKNALFQAHRNEAQVQLESMQKTKDEIMDQMKDVLAKLKELKENRTEKEKHHAEISRNCEKYTKVVDELKEKFNALERKDLQCREKLKHSKAKTRKLDNDLETEEQNLEKLKNQPGTYETEITGLETKKLKLEADRKVEEEKLTKVMASLKEETQGHQENKDKYEAQLIELKRVVYEEKSKMDISKLELDIYVSNERNEQTKLLDMTKSLESTVSNQKQKKQSIDDAEKRIPETKEKLEKCQQKLSDILEEEGRLSTEVKNKRQKVEEVKSAMHASRNRGKVLQSLMQQKSLGNLPGILGRLGDLGAIDEKYDVAISTACGPLDNIVTDTMSTAQKSVEFLKKNNVGYATFIALDKMQKWVPYTKQNISTPESVPRLFDLVKVKDDRVLPAFYFSLRDTLVANNLEQATRIGLQGRTRHRVVTLKGELIDFSGTMSGGGGRVSKGRMGQSIIADGSSPHEVEKMVKNLDELLQSISSMKEMKIGLEDNIFQMKKEISIMEHSLQKFKLEYQALRELEGALRIQIEDQKKKVASAAPDEAKVSALQAKVNNNNKEYTKAFEAAAKIEKKVQKIHSLIMEITEGKVSAAQEKLDTINNKIDGISSSITKATVAVKTSHRNIKKSDDKVKSLKQEISENLQLKEDLLAEFQCLEENGRNLLGNLDKAEDDKSASEEEIKEVMKEINVIKQQEHKLNSDNVEVKNKVDICTSKIKENQQKIKHWNSQISKLEVQEVDGQAFTQLPVLTSEEIENVIANDVQFEIAVLQEKLKGVKPNMAAIAEFKKKEAQYLEKAAELEEITMQRDTQRKHHDDLRKQRLNEFMQGFSLLTAKLKEMYQMITLGGDAELELVDSLDPFSEGIVFSVRPPKKSWKNISNLSGGEKTLSSLALVFALHYYKPTPFYVMDEIDAALDFKNVSIVGNYIKERTKNAQFIIISLRNNMFELSDRLVGIYKTYNCTKSITINPEKIEKIL